MQKIFANVSKSLFERPTLFQEAFHFRNADCPLSSTNGRDSLGDEDFDSTLHVAQEFHKDQIVDLRTGPITMQRLREAAEKAKIELPYSLQTDDMDASGPKHMNLKIFSSARLPVLPFHRHTIQVRTYSTNSQIEKTSKSLEFPLQATRDGPFKQLFTSSKDDYKILKSFLNVVIPRQFRQSIFEVNTISTNSKPLVNGKVVGCLEFLCMDQFQNKIIIKIQIHGEETRKQKQFTTRFLWDSAHKISSQDDTQNFENLKPTFLICVFENVFSKSNKLHTYNDYCDLLNPQNPDCKFQGMMPIITLELGNLEDNTVEKMYEIEKWSFFLKNVHKNASTTEYTKINDLIAQNDVFKDAYAILSNPETFSKMSNEEKVTYRKGNDLLDDSVAECQKFKNKIASATAEICFRHKVDRSIIIEALESAGMNSDEIMETLNEFERNKD